MPKGGKRPGAGMKKGHKYGPSIRKEEAREMVRLRIMEDFEELYAALYRSAVGVKHLMFRDPETGKFERVTGTAEQIDEALEKGAVWIHTKDPNTSALTDVFNRAFDKPGEQVQIDQNVNVNLNLEIRKKIDEFLIRDQKMLTEGKKDD